MMVNSQQTRLPVSAHCPNRQWTHRHFTAAPKCTAEARLGQREELLTVKAFDRLNIGTPNRTRYSPASWQEIARRKANTRAIAA